MTVALSSIVVVPPAESIVRLPEVSISLSPETPIARYQDAPPLASRAPVMVTPAENVAASATVSPSSVVAPSTSNVPDTVSLPVTARTVPLNVRLPLSSNSPDAPANTTLPDVRSPISSVCNKASIFAVPSRIGLGTQVDVPKSLAPSVDGTKSLSNLPTAVMVSLVASPKLTSPFAFNDVVVVPPVTFSASSTVTVPPAESRVDCLKQCLSHYLQ